MSQFFTATQMDVIVDMMDRTAISAANRALEAAGVTKQIISLAKVRKLYGSAFALDARNSPVITWIPKGKAGASSGLYCTNADLDKFINRRDFSFYNPKP